MSYLSTMLSRKLMRVKKTFASIVLGLLILDGVKGQPSHARLWNELILESIRGDFARPTVHARNLLHSSIAMYDAWALYHPEAETYLIGQTVGDFEHVFEGPPEVQDTLATVEEVLSYACYRLLKHRFKNAPKFDTLQLEYDALMAELGYDPSFTSVDYLTGPPSALGNYIAQTIIAYGMQDGANEINDYANQYYQPSNPPLEIDEPGNPLLVDPDRWQQLKLKVFIDQSGNILPITARDFLSPEWGNVVPFALQPSSRSSFERDEDTYWVYHDPGPPPYFTENFDAYSWGFALVAAWSSHLDARDTVTWDISPKSIGNVSKYPTSLTEYQEFYRLEAGGDNSLGHSINPHTGLAYEPQMVRRGDYARILAEFWADGPDSETPPGHWFTILNYVNDHPELERRFAGVGSPLSDLEWDVKAYLAMGGAMHDAAISAWSIKGWYDYIRPVSAIRYLADLGQSSDPSDLNYHPQGLPLISGKIELVYDGDILAGNDNENVGKIKLRAWRGPNFIFDPSLDVAGVGWILAENWWPYQRPSFVTPPFAGYVSGHSTYSAAAAMVLTELTGDPFFPGGLGEFAAPKDSFLVFERGPSQDIKLQWATYKDAADQCSLSRIWGGHSSSCR